MRPILSVSDKRLDEVRHTHGILAKHAQTQRQHVFILDKLPKGWRFVKVVNLQVSGLTVGEMREKLNEFLEIKVNSGKPAIQYNPPKLNESGYVNCEPLEGVETVNKVRDWVTIKQLDSQQWNTNLVGKYLSVDIDDYMKHHKRLTESALAGVKDNAGFVILFNGDWRITYFGNYWERNWDERLETTTA